jgi:hypothetical protein
MNIPSRIYQYNNRKYIRELSDFSQESYDLETLRKYLEKNWEDTLEIFDNYKYDDSKILLGFFCILYDNGGIFINYLNNTVNITDLLDFNYFFSLNSNFKNLMGTFKNNPIYRDMIDYMISIKNDIEYESLFEIINNYMNSNNSEILLIGSSTNKTKEISLDKKYINPIVLFNRSEFSDNFDYMYHDNKLVIIRTDSVSNWSQSLNVLIYDDIICNIFIEN